MTDDAAHRNVGAGLTSNQVDQFLSSPEATDELVREVLWRAVDTIRDIGRQQRHAVAGIVAAAATFELLNRSLVAEASFAGVKLARLDLFLALTPVVIAFFYLRLVSLARDLVAYTLVLGRLTEKRFPGLYTSRLDRTFALVGGQLFSMLRVSVRPPWARIELFAVMSELLATNALPVAFLVYAYAQLFTHTGDAALVWVSLALTAALYGLALTMLLVARTIDPVALAREEPITRAILGHRH